MRARAEPGRDTRLRAVAALVTCLLALALVVVAGETSHAHKHAGRGAATVAAVGTDTQHAASRGDHHGATSASPTIVAALLSWRGTADSSTAGSSRTAQSPPVRGPPVEAAA